uniref:Putative mitochondrial/plastidial beta-ketoacyl-acp reductase n=1 Tax=Ixodes ricinus TaxID=34613 RepID=A0A0K8R3B1_IXORI
MLKIRQYVFWLVLCCIITGRASSADDPAGSSPPESLPEGGIAKSDKDSNPKYDPGTSSLELQGRLAIVTGGSKGTFLITKRAVQHMLKRNVTEAAIVNIGSILGKGGFPGLSANTPVIQQYSNDTILKRLETMIPMKRIADPLEISETIVFMCSPKTSYMTGSVVDVAGGTML